MSDVQRIDITARYHNQTLNQRICHYYTFAEFTKKEKKNQLQSLTPTQTDVSLRKTCTRDMPPPR